MENIDFLGSPLNFQTKDKPRLTSKYGGVMSIFILFVIVLTTLAFGNSFFNRTNPTIINSRNIPEEYTFLNLTNKDFTFALRVEDYDGNLIDGIETSFYFNGSYILYDLIDGSWEETIVEDISLNQCSKDNIGEDFDQAIHDMGNLYCINFSGKPFGGYWDGNKLGYFYIKTWYCNEGQVNDKGEKCSLNAYKDDILNNVAYVSLYQQKAEVYPVKYEPELVMKKKMYNVYYQIDKLATKVLYLYYQNITVSTDYGWILEEKNTKSFLGLKEFHFDIFNINYNKDNKENYSVFEITIHYGKEELIYLREYSKIQVLAANVGGILKFVILFGSVIIHELNLIKYLYECQSLITRYTDNQIHPYLDKNLKLTKSFIFSKSNVNSLKNFDNDYEDYFKKSSIKDEMKYNENNSKKNLEDTSRIINNLDKSENFNKDISSFDLNCKKEIFHKSELDLKVKVDSSLNVDKLTPQNIKQNEYSLTENSKNKVIINPIEYEIAEYKKELENNKKTEYKTENLTNNRTENGKTKKCIIKENIQKELQKKKNEDDCFDPQKNMMALRIIEDDEELEKARIETIDLCKIFHFVWFKLCLDGKCCFNKKERDNYIKKEAAFNKVLDFADFINNKIALKRLMNILLTKEQQMIINK